MSTKNINNYTSLSGPSGDKLYGSLDMQYNTILNLTDPIYSNDAVTKSYVDSKTSSVSNDLNMNNHKIIHLGTPTNNNDAANKNYVDTLYNDPNIFISDLSGSDTVTGQLNVGLGPDSLSNISTGTDNIAIGSSALTTNTTGSKNIAIGSNTLQNRSNPPSPDCIQNFFAVTFRR